MANRHKFTVMVSGGCVVALVPAASEGEALARLVADDAAWKGDVNYQGSVKWAGGPGPIDFTFVGRAVS